MNMNINPVGFGNKLLLSRIKFAKDINNKELPVDNYVREMLIEHGNEIEKLQIFWGKMLFWLKGESFSLQIPARELP